MPTTVKVRLILIAIKYRFVEMWNSPKNERHSSTQRGSTSVETVATTPSRVFPFLYSGGQQRHHPPKIRPTDYYRDSANTGFVGKNCPVGEKPHRGFHGRLFVFCMPEALPTSSYMARRYSCDNVRAQSTALCKANFYTCVQKFHHRLSPALVNLNIKSIGEKQKESIMLPNIKTFDVLSY